MQTMKKGKNIVVLEYIRLDIILTVLYCYLENEYFEMPYE